MPSEDDFNLDSAIDTISTGLGFSVDKNEDLPADPPEEGNGNNGTSTGSGAAAPTPAASSSGTSAPAPASVAATGAATSTPSPAPAPKPGFSPDALPRTWKPELGAKWASVDPEIRAEIARREEAMFHGLEGYRQSAKVGNDFQRTITPYLEKYQRYGIDPMQDVAGLLRARDVLSFGTAEEKIAVVRNIIKDFGIQLPGDTTAASGEPPYTDPQVAGLQKEVQELKSNLSRADQERAAVKMAEIRSQVEAFANDPANIYFADVADDIARLMQSGVSKDLKEAYEKAVWANPVTRAKEQQRLTEAAAAKAKEDEAARVAAARKATGANVRTTAKSTSGTAPTGSIDDTLQETLAAIRGRS